MNEGRDVKEMNYKWSGIKDSPFISLKKWKIGF